MRRLIILKNIKREGPGLFKFVARQRGLVLLEVNLYLGEKVPSLTSNDIVLIMGGPMGISDINNDLYKWLPYELEVINFCILNDISMIGICLGAQLIAYSLGGDIVKLKLSDSAKYIKEIGWGQISLAKEFRGSDPILENLLPLYVLHWHSDRIILPSNTNLLASSKYCREQFYSYSTNVYGLQFHLEIENNDLDIWIGEDTSFIESQLGERASEILIEQNSIFLNKSKAQRISFINYLFNKLSID